MDYSLKGLAREGWVILAFLSGLIIWYANVNSRLTTVEARVEEQKLQIVQLSELRTDIAVIKTDVAYIKQQLK